MIEFDEAVKIANLWLDKPYEDPDSDTCILARQFLRSIEAHANLDHLKREVRKRPDGYEMCDDDYDLGWNAAIKKCSEYYSAKNTNKLSIHILLDVISQLGRRENLDPETCQHVETIAKESSYKDFTAEDIQALYEDNSAQRQPEVTIQINSSQLTVDLVSLIMRLSWKLGSDQKLTKQAMDFLERKGLTSSPLRTDEFKKLCDEVEMEDR